eukprot:9965032-Alexandrium_andersonii.AAC.1
MCIRDSPIGPERAGADAPKMRVADVRKVIRRGRFDRMEKDGKRTLGRLADSRVRRAGGACARPNARFWAVEASRCIHLRA